jgi:hypothetical protein
MKPVNAENFIKLLILLFIFSIFHISMILWGIGSGMVLIPTLPDAQLCATLKTGRESTANKVREEWERGFVIISHTLS